MSSTKRKRKGHEWSTFEGLKGQVVRIFPTGTVSEAQAWVGRLVWVDVYTVGVVFDWQHDPEQVAIVHKAGIVRIELYE